MNWHRKSPKEDGIYFLIKENTLRVEATIKYNAKKKLAEYYASTSQSGQVLLNGYFADGYILFGPIDLP